jgi:tetratricopeptide (TPR) repeat protein
LRINHVELGLNNDEQMPIRDGLTESYLGLDDLDKANFQQATQARIIREEHRGDLDKMIPAIYKLADWYQRSNQPEKETLLLQNAARTIKKAAGDNPTEQIRVLRALAAAHQRLDMPAEAMRLLKKAWRINEESATRDPLLSADIQVEMGDFYNGFNDLRRARRYYTLAWETLVNEGGNDSTRLLENYFSHPIIIWSIQLPDVHPLNSKTAVLAAEEPDLFSEGLLAMEFDIDQNGRATNIRIIESDPEGLMDKRIIYLLGRYFYRPRFEDGMPVLTRDIQLSHSFSYLAKSAKKDPGRSKDNSGGRLEYPGNID